MNLNFPLCLFQKAGGNYPPTHIIQTAAQKSQRVARVLGLAATAPVPRQAAGMLAQPRAALPMQGGFSFFQLVY